MKSSYREFRIQRPSVQQYDAGKTDQSFQKDADINTIVARFLKDPHNFNLKQKVGFFQEEPPPVTDLLSAYELINATESAFASLPAKVREYFANDPFAVSEFVRDPSNRDKAIELGLIPKSEEIDTPPVSPVVTQVPPVSKKATGKTTTINDDDTP